MPALLIATLIRPWPRSRRGSNSRPTRNIKKTSPSCATRPSPASDSAGKSRVSPPGQSSPSTLGPSAMPATISAITEG